MNRMRIGVKIYSVSIFLHFLENPFLLIEPGVLHLLDYP